MSKELSLFVRQLQHGVQQRFGVETFSVGSQKARRPYPRIRVKSRHQPVPFEIARMRMKMSTWTKKWEDAACHRLLTYINSGSPTPLISGIVHFKSNAFDRMICWPRKRRNVNISLVISRARRVRRARADEKRTLKIFCTLMECEVEQKIKGAFIALANLRACVRTCEKGKGSRCVR